MSFIGVRLSIKGYLLIYWVVIVRREPGRDGKILCDHRQDGNDEVHRL